MTDPDFIDKVINHLQGWKSYRRLDVLINHLMWWIVGFAIACAVIQGR